MLWRKFITDVVSQQNYNHICYDFRQEQMHCHIEGLAT